MYKRLINLTTILTLCFLAAGVQARLKLVALPEREATLVRLDNPNATLVEEERTLTLQEGENQVDFSWQGVKIDPDTIRIALISHPDTVKLISVSYPPNENALVWQIYSPQAYEEKIRLSYLLGDLDKLVTYKAVVDKAETKIDLNSYLILRNFSGEDLNSAQIKLDYGETFEKTIQNEETQQLLFLSKKDLKIEKTFTFDAAKQPWDPEQQQTNVGIPVHYVLKNNPELGLGENALLGGKARVFQTDGQGGTIFLGEDNLKFTPVGEEMALYIGDSRDVVVTQRKMADKRINLRYNHNRAIILYDTDEVMEVKVENFKDQPAELTLIEHIEGEWEMMQTSHAYLKEDANTLKFQISLAPKAKETVSFNYQRRNLR